MRSLSDVVAHLFHPRRSNNHRARVLHPEALLLLLLIVGGLYGGFRIFTRLRQFGGILGYASNINPSQVVEATNRERASQGLSALQYNGQLSQAALAKAQDMLNDQYWAHTAPDGTEPWTFIRQSGYGYKVAGENLARDFGDTGGMMSAWMASPTHRANILSTKYNDIGVAVVDGVLQGVETTLVVQMFGSSSRSGGQVSAAAKPSSPPVPASPRPSPSVVSSTSPLPIASPEPTPALPVAQLAAAPVSPSPMASVLASVLLPLGSIEKPPLFTPLQLTKALFLAVILMIVLTLVYDTAVIGHRRAARLVGQNLGHLALLLAVAFLLIFFKGGIIG